MDAFTAKLAVVNRRRLGDGPRAGPPARGPRDALFAACDVTPTP